MHIFIVTFGTRGDVQPFVALGKGLQAAGHRVTICTSSSFEPFITAHGLTYGYAANDLVDFVDSTAGRDAMENTVGLFGTFNSMRKLLQQGKAINRRLLQDSWRAAQMADPDVVIFHPKALAGVHIAEKLGVPVLLAQPLPAMMPTAAFPAVGMPMVNLGGWYNRLTYKLVELGYRTYADIVDEFRQQTLGLTRFPRSLNMLQTASGQPIPVLHAYSPHVVPRPQDWPAQAYVTGYWFLDRTADWQPPAALQAFLDKGEAPVYVGFGSIAGRDPQRMASIVVAALQQARVRGIIATGWGGLDVGTLPDTIFKIDQAPHDWLFPRISAVVHHGGAGSTAAGLRAGRPTIICSFFGDQPFWGQRVHTLGVGSQPIPQKKLTAEKLARALHEVTTDPAIRQRAAALGEQIRQEDGIVNAIDVIETYIEQLV